MVENDRRKIVYSMTDIPVGFSAPSEFGPCSNKLTSMAITGAIDAYSYHSKPNAKRGLTYVLKVDADHYVEHNSKAAKKAKKLAATKEKESDPVSDQENKVELVNQRYDSIISSIKKTKDEVIRLKGLYTLFDGIKKEMIEINKNQINILSIIDAANFSLVGSDESNKREQ